VSPQQHCDGVFYGGVDGIQATASELQAAVLPPGAPTGPAPHLQAVTPNRPCSDNLGAACGASACKVSTAVRLQAAARSLLACQRLQEMCQPMHEVTLATVGLSTGEHDLALWDGHQQARRPAAIFRHEYGVFPAGSDLQLCGSGGSGATPLLVISEDALPSATAVCHRPPRGRLR